VYQTCTFKKWFFGHYHDNKTIGEKMVLLYKHIVCYDTLVDASGLVEAEYPKRDKNTYSILDSQGWRIIIAWECELKKSVMEQNIQKLVKQIKQE